MIPRAFILTTLSVLLACCAQSQDTLDSVDITVVTPAGHIDLTVELADDPHEISTGLMGRPDIGRHDGMLFLSDAPRVPQFWMKDTLIPLDMIFIEEDGTISLVAPDRQPGDLSHVSPERPVIAVLELEAGKSAQMGLREGDTVILPASEK